MKSEGRQNEDDDKNIKEELGFKPKCSDKPVLTELGITITPSCHKKQCGMKIIYSSKVDGNRTLPEFEGSGVRVVGVNCSVVSIEAWVKGFQNQLESAKSVQKWAQKMCFQLGRCQGSIHPAWASGMSQKNFGRLRRAMGHPIGNGPWDIP
ncbi:hypothetical protein B0H12DRAFT_1077951 [Mycena haematopus]|nr:hypothetical protein B0H12DRAFT_1077951 [Mycena haematopus]